MRLFAFLSAFLAAVALHAASNDLQVARQALGDGLDQIAVRRAGKAAEAARDAETRRRARLVELEALADMGRPEDMLKRLDGWTGEETEDLRYWRAWALVRLGRPDAARPLLDRPYAQPAYAALALRLSARLETAATNAPAAGRQFALAAAALASNGVARAENAVEWARALDGFGDAPGALAVLQKEGATGCAGDVGDVARLLQSRLLAKTGKAAEGRQVLEGLVARGTNVSERTYVLAACDLAENLQSAGATNRALQVVSNAVARAAKPDLVCRAGYALGFALFASPATRPEGASAISALVRKFPEDPQSGAAQLRLADGMLAVGDAEGAVREYGVLLQAYPAHALDAHALEGLGWGYLKLGRRAEAVGIFARAAQVATDEGEKARCSFKQGEALVADGRYEEAAAVYGAVAHEPLREAASFRRADALARAKQTAAADEIFRALFKAGGALAVEAGLRAAASEVAQNRVTEALATYDAVLGGKDASSLAPEQRGRALAGRGRALYRALRFTDAARDFAEVARLQPARRDEMGFFSVLCLYGDNQDREAYEAGRRLLGTVQDSPLKGDLQMWLAKYDAGRREWQAAIAGFEACAANPHVGPSRQVEALVRGLRCAVAMPDYTRAIALAARVSSNAVAKAAMTKALPESAYAAEALVLQGVALTELARFDDALLVFEHAERVPAPPEILRRARLARADCLFAMGADNMNRYRGALEAYSALARDDGLSDSQRLSVAFMKGRTFQKLGQLEDAADQYYTNVVLTYWEAVQPGAVDSPRRRWFDSSARAVFARACFILADYYEARHERDQAEHVLSYVVNARVPAADEAKRRIARLRKGGTR